MDEYEYMHITGALTAAPPPTDIGEIDLVADDFVKLDIQSGDWWRHLVAGGIAGCMSRTCTAPLDRIKVYLQVHANRQNHFNIISSAKYMINEGGIRSFWRGNGINVAKIAPESALKFMAYEEIKRLIQRNNSDGELSTVERFVAGSIAGAASQSITYPLEVLKTRLALRKTGELAKGLRHFAHRILQKEGLRCCYKGYLPNLIGIIPYAGIDLTVYEKLKSVYVRRHNGASEPGVVILLLCGTCSCTCGQLASYPLALVRTRLQAAGGIVMDLCPEIMYILAILERTNATYPDTMTGQFKYIYRTEGFFGFYRGITPNFMKVVPAVSISYVVYETVRQYLGATMT